MTDFLLNRRTKVKINNFTLLKILVMMKISQELLISSILYLFYNIDLLKSYKNIRLRTNVTDFVNNVNILIYNENTEQNCLKLIKIYKKCQS